MKHIAANQGDEPSEDISTPPLAYWRTFRAEEFDQARVDEVAACVASISSTIPEWRAAVEGNAAAAIGLVLPCRAPGISLKVDLPMMTLLNVAFINPAAAAVLSHRLRRMSISICGPVSRHHGSYAIYGSSTGTIRGVRAAAGQREERGDDAAADVRPAFRLRRLQRLPEEGVAVVVVAGDTREGIAPGLRELREAYPAPIEIVAIAGNHEVWGGTWPTEIEAGRRTAAELGVPDAALAR
ncbi:hypothetical protein [Bradyrhizobium sp. USDA 4529]